MSIILSQLYSEITNQEMKRIEDVLSKKEPVTLNNLHEGVEPDDRDPSDIFYLAMIRLAAEGSIKFRHQKGSQFLIYKRK
jgi:hypothetical protein